MNNRLRFRAGFKVCYYDKDGNNKELLVKVNNCFAIENGGDEIIINEDIIKDFIKDLSTAEQNSVWEYMQANFDETNDYWFIDKLKYLDQCIGLKDRNGKLIYKGDIVELSEAYEDGIYKIEFCQSDCEYDLYNREDNFIYQLTKSMTRYMEVIGNIHENKDLLK